MDARRQITRVGRSLLHPAHPSADGRSVQAISRPAELTACDSRLLPNEMHTRGDWPPRHPSPRQIWKELKQIVEVRMRHRTNRSVGGTGGRALSVDWVNHPPQLTLANTPVAEVGSATAGSQPVGVGGGNGRRRAPTQARLVCNS